MAIVVTSDNQEFVIPDNYWKESEFFQLSSNYRSSLGFSSSDIRVDFDYEQLLLIEQPIIELNHIEVMASYDIDTYFQNGYRLREAESHMVNFWLGYSYHLHSADDYQVVKDIVTRSFFKDLSVAVKVFLHERHLELSNSNWNLIQHYEYYAEIADSILEYVTADDLHLVSHVRYGYDVDKILATVKRVSLPGEDVHVFDEEIEQVMDYYNLINGYKHDNYDNYLFSIMKFEDVDNSAWNRLYNRLILQVGITIRQPEPATFEQAIRSLYDADKDVYVGYPVELFKNNDIEVIKKVMTRLAEYGILPYNNIDNILNSGISPAAVKLIGTGYERDIDVRRLDTFNLLNNDIVVYEPVYVEVAWYLIVNGREKKIVNVADRDEYIIHVIDKHPRWILDVVANPVNVHLIPVIDVYYQDPRLAQVLAQLGGKIDTLHDWKYISNSLFDLMMDYEFDFTQLNKYSLTDIVDNSSNYVRSKLAAITGVSYEPTTRVKLMYEGMRTANLGLEYKPDHIDRRRWLRALNQIDRYAQSDNESAHRGMEMSIRSLMMYSNNSRDVKINIRNLIYDKITLRALDSYIIKREFHMLEDIIDTTSVETIIGNHIERLNEGRPNIISDYVYERLIESIDAYIADEIDLDTVMERIKAEMRLSPDDEEDYKHDMSLLHLLELYSVYESDYNNPLIDELLKLYMQVSE